MPTLARMLHVATFVATALALTPALAAIDPDTAVGVWLMDEDGGDTAIDSSGRGFDGALNSAEWTAGKFGSALEFDGASWVSVPDQPELQAGDQLAMVAWFFAEDIGDWRQLIAKNQNPPSNRSGTRS